MHARLRTRGRGGRRDRVLASEPRGPFGETSPLSEAELVKSEQRLRQRFKCLKDRLKELAKAEGLL